MEIEDLPDRWREHGRKVMGQQEFGKQHRTDGIMSDSLIDAKIAASEARTDAKFARFDARVEQLVTSLGEFRQEVRAELREVGARGATEMRATRNAMWQGVFVTIASILSVIAIVASVMWASFDAGSNVRTMVRDEVKATQSAVPAKAPPAAK